MGAHLAVDRLGKLGQGKKRDGDRPKKARSDADVPEVHADIPAPGSQTGMEIPASGAEPVRIKIRETVSGAVPAERRPSAPAVQQSIKTREASSARRQMDSPMEGTAQSEKRGQKKFVRERGKTASGRRAEFHSRGRSSVRAYSAGSAPARRAAVAPLAAGGGAVIAVVLVLCLMGRSCCLRLGSISLVREVAARPSPMLSGRSTGSMTPNWKN